MDLTEFIAELRTDLKDSGTVWSDAELTRCINRAVDDLSRSIPRERIYEHTYKNAVTDESFTTPATSDPDYVVDGVTINGETDGATLSMTGYLWLDVPRPVIVTLTDANVSISSMTLIVKGTDADGAYREEKFFRHDGKVQTGKIYFSSISQVELNKVTGNGPGDTIDVGTGSHEGVWVQLVNPIYPNSETVTTTDGATSYAKDTDYEIDYSNGRIAMKSGGGMSAGTEYYIDYTKSRIAVDISSFLPHMFRILEVEYPADKVPQQLVSWTIYENLLYIGSQKSGTSQERLTDGEHVTIYYESRQTPPTLVSKGSYPEHLDQIVSIGAGGYALLIEALQYEQQAVTDLASTRTELGLTTAVHTLADTALDNAAVYLTTGVDDCAKGALAKITDNIAELRTKIQTAQGAMATELGLVGTYSLDKAEFGAEAYLDTYDGNIITVNLADDVAGKGALYAQTRVQIALARIQKTIAYGQEAANRLDNLRSYVEEGTAWTRVSETFVAEGRARIDEIRTYLEEGAHYYSVAQTDLVLADRFREEGNQRLAKFFEMLKSRSEYRRKTVSVPVRQPA